MRATKRILFLMILIGVSASASRAQIPDSMMDTLFSSQGRIGVRVQSMTPELREYFESPADRGVLIAHVEPDRPAAQAGLMVGDVIITAGTKSVAEPLDLLRALNRVALGETIDLTVIRAKGELTVRVTPEGDPNPWIDPEHWRDTLEEHLEHGSSALRDQLDKLQRRLDELEREFKEHREEKDDGQRT
jgi:membrane-associated protease RseP (regulator of RpoE activity)